MSVLVDKNTRLVVQGITGSAGAFHTRQCIEYGTDVVAGVTPGNVGVISRSGTLTYEAVWQLTSRGYGQSTCIGIGGDPIHGLSHLDAVKLFNEDPGTEAMILIGEIGGSAEEEAAEWIRMNCKK